MNTFKLIAIVTAAFVAGHDIAVTRANRRIALAEAFTQKDLEESRLRGFTEGRASVVADLRFMAGTDPVPSSQSTFTPDILTYN